MKIHCRLFHVFCVLVATLQANAFEHIILKSDLELDGRVDRVVYASHGVSGFVQSTLTPKLIDSFYFKQGNRTVSGEQTTTNNSSYWDVILEENLGFFNVAIFLRSDDLKTFKIVDRFILKPIQYSSNGDFDEVAPASENTEPNPPVNPPKAYSSEAVKPEVSDRVRRAIGPGCREIFGADFGKLETDVLFACGISNGPKERNNLVACLDRNEQTKVLGALYKRSLVSNVFEDGFKFTCEKSNKSIPLAKFDSVSKTIKLFAVTPKPQMWDFRKNIFHELLHENVNGDAAVNEIVNQCLSRTKGVAVKRVNRSNVASEKLKAAMKDGTQIRLPARAAEPPAVRPIAQAVASTATTLDSNYATTNQPQFETLTTASRSVFRSVDPLMNATVAAAVPEAMAASSAPTIIASGRSSRSVATRAPSSVVVSSTSSLPVHSDPPPSLNEKRNPSLLNGLYVDTSLPIDREPKKNGDLGNGFKVSSQEVRVNEGSVASATSTSGAAPAPATAGATANESPSRVPSSTSSIISGGGAPNAGTMASAVAAPASMGADEPAPSGTGGGSRSPASVPQADQDANLIRALTTGRYQEVKERLLAPESQESMELRRIQYIDLTNGRERIYGSLKPVVILKDLGNKFSIRSVRVN